VIALLVRRGVNSVINCVSLFVTRAALYRDGGRRFAVEAAMQRNEDDDVIRDIVRRAF
jgi:hypothetical protein